jgi:eukaryotic-like serine/threonine-protein kinase
MSDDVVLELDPQRRYEDLGLLGEGGMGEVRASRDLALGRTVARKLNRPLPGDTSPHTAARAQFLREARVQGQLEHPAVAPVYDVAREPSGEIFFTMKRVVGVTLARVLDVLRDEDPVGTKRFGRHRLLSAFLQVCQCIEYAHSRGVVHRDLKPSNIMFGDFGEVYVLDWGVAVVSGEPHHIQIGILEQTPSGVGGTPGYMAPEQLVDGATLDARTDVYGLGALLFEILTLLRLHDADDPDALKALTRKGSDARPSVRAPARDVPPELEAICVRATALEPLRRYATAREVADAVEAFLEGNRDYELRKEIAARHVAEAKRLVDLALSDHTARSRALGELGRALALQPDSPEAAEVLGQLFASPPDETPPEVALALDAEKNEEGRSASTLGGWIFLVMALSGVVMWGAAGAHLAWSIVLFVTASTLASLIAFATRNNPNDASGLAMIFLGTAAIASSSGALGPLVLTPILALAFAMITVNVGRLSRFRMLFVVLSCASFAVPALLEIAGVLPRSYLNEGGRWVIVSKVTDVPADRIYPFGLFFGCLTATIGSALFAWRMAERTARLRRQLQMYVWNLKQLVPHAPQGGGGKP